MAKVTYSEVDRTQLETSLMEKKTDKYVVIYPTYEFCHKDDVDGDAEDFSAGSIITAAPVDNKAEEIPNSVCTNIFGVLSTRKGLPRLFSLRAIIAQVTMFCKKNKIAIVIIPAALLNEIMTDGIDRDILTSLFKEIMVGTAIEVIVTPNVTDDDMTSLKTIRDALDEIPVSEKKIDGKVSKMLDTYFSAKMSKANSKKNKSNKKKGKKNKGGKKKKK